METDIMELSIFLARLIGIYMLVIGALAILRREAMFAAVDEFLADRPAMFLSGVIALVLGTAMAIGHSVWEPNWRGLITVIGYLSIAKGIVRIGFPDVPKKAAGRFRDGPLAWIWLGLVLLIGGYLTWVGFSQG
jgi:hypothetical protein